MPKHNQLQHLLFILLPYMCHKYSPKLYMYHMCDIYDMNIYGMYAQNYITSEITGINYLISSIVHIYHISLNKYSYQTVNIGHASIMLDRHIEPTWFHICTKIQPTEMSASHDITKYVWPVLYLILLSVALWQINKWPYINWGSNTLWPIKLSQWMNTVSKCVVYWCLLISFLVHK